MSGDETPEAGGAPLDQAEDRRLKRLGLRCWRRGTKEMDLLIGGYADRLIAEARAGRPDEAAIARLEALIELDDPPLYTWITGKAPADPVHAETIEAIRRTHGLA